MAFIIGTEEYRIWSMTNKKCLVLKKDKVSNPLPEVTCAGEGDEDERTKKGSSAEEGERDETIEKSSGKSKLLILIVFTCAQLVTYLTINFDSQLCSPRTKHYQAQPALETAAFDQDLTF